MMTREGLRQSPLGSLAHSSDAANHDGRPQMMSSYKPTNAISSSNPLAPATANNGGTFYAPAQQSESYCAPTAGQTSYVQGSSAAPIASTVTMTGATTMRANTTGITMPSSEVRRSSVRLGPSTTISYPMDAGQSQPQPRQQSLHQHQSMYQSVAGVGHSSAAQTITAQNNSALLAAAANRSTYHQDNIHFSSTVSPTKNTVPTQLFTSYIPANQIQGWTARRTSDALNARSDCAISPDGTAVYNPNVDAATLTDIHNLASGQNSGLRTSGLNPKGVTIFYTDNTYPPYLARARKTATYHKKIPGCCA